MPSASLNRFMVRRVLGFRPRPTTIPVGTIRTLRFEALEDRRVLAALIGIDFGGGAVPANWTSITSVENQSNATPRLNLKDETGGATAVDLNIYATYSGGAQSADTSLNASTIPQHTPSLAGLDDSVNVDSDVGVHSFVAEWSGLNPSATYEVYVFSAESTLNFVDRQKVTIIGSGSNVVFDQSPMELGELWINSSVGSSGQPLSNYKVQKQPNTAGAIGIVITMNLDSDVLTLAGLAIRDTTTVTVDFDGNGRVAGGDFLNWQRGFGKTSGATVANGNSDNDGDVDGVDLTNWKNAFGQPASSEALAASDGPNSLAALSSAPATSAAARGSSPLTRALADAALTLGLAPRQATPTRRHRADAAALFVPAVVQRLHAVSEGDRDSARRSVLHDLPANVESTDQSPAAPEAIDLVHAALDGMA